MGGKSSSKKETVNLLKTGDYYFIGQVSKIKLVGENVEVKLRKPSGHIWLGWPTTDPELAPALDIERGDSVRLDFIQNGHGVLGVHKLYSIKKMEYK